MEKTENIQDRRIVFVRVLIVVLVMAVILALLLKIRPQKWVVVDSGRIIKLGTIAQVKIRCLNEKAGRQALFGAWRAIDKVDALLSTYRQDSEIMQVNRLAAGQKVEISPETYSVIALARHYSDISGGAFDITVGPILQVWKNAAANNRLPTERQLQLAQKKVGYKKIILSRSGTGKYFIHFSVEGVALNVDAIAKGYAVDRALAAIRKPGIMGALVDIGGEVACFGMDQPHRAWLVGIQDPFAGDNDNQFSEHPRWLLRLQDGAVATSGNYRRYRTIAGKHYSHIVDPRSGWPVDTLPSVTVVAADTADADALATAISVMGPEDGLKLVNSLDGVEAFLVGGSRGKPVIYRSKNWVNSAYYSRN